jgi:ubiquinone/menaquinone biosynthesis C-methylase UbiE
MNVTEAPAPPSGLGWSARRVRYRAQHASLALASAALLRTFFRFFAPDRPRNAPRELVRRVIERHRALLERDLENVERGLYPESLLTQFPLGQYLARLPEGLLEAPRIVRRRRDDAWRELPPDAALGRFPRYYLRNFHWQPDGWFSERSARLYDLEVEILFGGAADVMRRMAIPPLAAALRDVEHPRVLDVACGTGRFLSQVHRALPSAKLYGLDLSPFYVREASRVLADVPDVSLVVDDAERLPFGDRLFDAVTSVFLFHELPRASRKTVIAEALRVLRPGGTLVLCDSAQRIESPELSFFLDDFAETFHEPFFRDYVDDPLEELLHRAGFIDVRSEPHLVSKVVYGQKPFERA